MKISSAAAFLLFSASAAAFAPSARVAFQQRTIAVQPAVVALRMSTEEEAAPKAAPPASKGGALVPIKEETVEFTAGLIGGIAGLVLGGPLLAFISAAATNYISKTEGDVADVVQAVSKSSIQVFNYLSNLDSKYEILEKAKKSLEGALDNLKKQETVDKETIAKVEDALAKTNKKIKEINDEYDLVGGGLTALGVVGDLVEKAIKKAGELNSEYNLTEKAKEALTGAVSKAKEAAKDINK